MLNEFFTNYADYEYPLASSQLFLAMLGMGALLAPRDFLLEVQRPRGLFLGLVCQWVAVPMVALSLGLLLPIPAGIAVGLILVAAVPGGTLSNILTHFGNGNIALSISLTSITTVAALPMTPLLLQLLMSEYLPREFEMPTARIAQDIFLTLIVPLMMGMVIKSRCRQRASEAFSQWVIRFSLALIVVMAVGAGGSGRLDPQAYGTLGIAALALFGILVMVMSALMVRLAGLPSRDGLAIVIESTFRNMSLAVAIKAIVFPAQTGISDPIGDAVFFTALLYGGVSLVMSLIPVFGHRRLVSSRG
ncbi:MAG: bile acid:sodium symporter [Pseudomonadota bacterium]